ncbi:hypothetical protein [Streptomyces halobius]|uniref:Uncharacterized protein n=1 Tax=Streptomyces halobius TaxID=2879846 RepID=A0ABY4M2Q1_9ACTN|nr:hypothetical protein [Streptomyces halobius]UQA90676.1 hypothetical protein K9S39_01120 [Streptomyces halobius]
MRAPKDPRFVAMGWLCLHYLCERRDQPRRRDVLLRLFPQLEGLPTGAWSAGTRPVRRSQDMPIEQQATAMNDYRKWLAITRDPVRDSENQVCPCPACRPLTGR